MPPIRELKEKYGGDSRQAVNRAIRAEIVGGDDMLDALPLVDRLTLRIRERELAGLEHAQSALDNLRSLRDVMASIVLR